MENTEVIAKISDAEWEIMRVVWAQKETTSKAVTAILNNKTEWKATTVKTLLSRLVEKKMLATKPLGNKFIYFPIVAERQSIEALSEAILTKICSRKVATFVETILSASLLSFDDIEKIEKLLQAKRQTAVEKVPCNCTPGQCQCHLQRETE